MEGSDKDNNHITISKESFVTINKGDITQFYEVMKKIGEGSFGQIYIAIHIETKEEYAVKIVSKIIFNIT